MIPQLLEHADWSFPIPIRYGPGRIAELGEVCRQAGMRRPLVITDRGSRELPFVDKALASLRDADLAPGLYAEVSPNPTGDNVASARAHFLEAGHDGLVALGGGSGMDAAKAVSLTACNNVDLWRFDMVLVPPAGLDASHFVPIVCVPTTAGTGAETECAAMVTNTSLGTKACLLHPANRPAGAILDPELTLGLPPTLTAWTGCDALVHAIEALSVPSWHPLCDGLALEAIRLVSRWLPTAYHDGDHLEARGAMLAGSCLAGVSFLKGLGLVHAMSHMVGAVHDTQHGQTNAVLLPVVLRYNRAVLGDKLATMCHAMRLPETGFDAFYAAVTALLDEVAIPRGLADLGVDAGSLADIAAKAHTDPARATNPRDATVADIEALLREALVAAR